MLRGANYSLRGLKVPNELIRRVACRLDLHHLKRRDEPTGAAAPSPEVRSCDAMAAKHRQQVKCLGFFIALNFDWVLFSQFPNFQMVIYEKGGFGASPPINERNPNVLTPFL